HPGVVLMKDFLEPLELSQNKVALSIGVHPRRINEIVHGNRSVTADTALRLGQYFNVSPEFWMNIQYRYDLESAKEKNFETILKEVRPLNKSK
ncbi:MAG: HigA family addiction module antitoxin, partial [Candidatus Paceibacterota bacterium]